MFLITDLQVAINLKNRMDFFHCRNKFIKKVKHRNPLYGNPYGEGYDEGSTHLVVETQLLAEQAQDAARRSDQTHQRFVHNIFDT